MQFFHIIFSVIIINIFVKKIYDTYFIENFYLIIISNIHPKFSNKNSNIYEYIPACSYSAKSFP